MNAPFRTVLLVLASALLPSAALAQEVTTKKILPKRAREEVLDLGAAMLAPSPSGTLERLRATRSPFQKPVPVAENAPAGPDGTPAAPVVTRLSNADALQAIGAQLKPRGTIIFGTSRILRLERGQLKAGDAIPATIAGEQYDVVVDRIDADSYTLRLGGQTLSLPTNPGLSSGVSRDRAPAPAPAPAP